MVRKLFLTAAFALSSLLTTGAAWADFTILVPSGSEGDGLRAAAADYSAMKNTKVEIVQAPYANVFERSYNSARSWDQVDVRALWSPTGNKYTLIAYVKNVLNDDGYAAAVAASQRNNNPGVPSDRFLNGARNFELTPPRLYGVELQYRF